MRTLSSTLNPSCSSAPRPQAGRSWPPPLLDQRRFGNNRGPSRYRKGPVSWAHSGGLEPVPLGYLTRYLTCAIADGLDVVVLGSANPLATDAKRVLPRSEGPSDLVAGATAVRQRPGPRPAQTAGSRAMHMQPHRRCTTQCRRPAVEDPRNAPAANYRRWPSGRYPMMALWPASPLDSLIRGMRNSPKGPTK